MARLFDGAGDFVRSTANAFSGADQSVHLFSCWIYMTANPASEQVALDFCADFSADTSRRSRLSVMPGTGSTFNLKLTIRRATTDYTWTTTDNYSLDAWHHVTCNVNRTNFTRPTIYVDGVLSTKSEVAGSGSASTGLDSISIGQGCGGTLDFAGTLGEVAYWSDTLSTSAITMLARGVSPLKVNRTTLLFYAPLWGFETGAEHELATGLALTNTNSTLASRTPPVIVPSFLEGGWNNNPLPMQILRRRREMAA